MKNGQVQVTLNWVYILIAGGVILLFFVGIVVKSKATAEEQLVQDVVQVMGNIFTGAGVSEKTKNFINTKGLADYTLEFDCDESVSRFGIKGQGGKIEDTTQPTFSPTELKTTNLILWSLPYKFPYKIIDFLFVTSGNTKYFFIGDDQDFIDEFSKATSDKNPRLRINWEHLLNVESAKPEKNFQVRVVDTDGLTIQEGLNVPLNLVKLDDKKVTAVSFTGKGQVDYFQKQGSIWVKLNKKPVIIVSLSGTRDAAKYGAIFAQNDKVYGCNMQKAFKRVSLVNQVYAGEEITSGGGGGKLRSLRAVYIRNQELLKTKPSCADYLGFNKNQEVQDLPNELKNFQLKVDACSLDYNLCSELIDSAAAISNINKQLQIDCIPLY